MPNGRRAIKKIMTKTFPVIFLLLNILKKCFIISPVEIIISDNPTALYVRKGGRNIIKDIIEKINLFFRLYFLFVLFPFLPPYII